MMWRDLGFENYKGNVGAKTNGEEHMGNLAATFVLAPVAALCPGFAHQRSEKIRAETPDVITNDPFFTFF